MEKQLTAMLIHDGPWHVSAAHGGIMVKAEKSADIFPDMRLDWNAKEVMRSGAIPRQREDGSDAVTRAAHAQHAGILFVPAYDARLGFAPWAG